MTVARCSCGDVFEVVAVSSASADRSVTRVCNHCDRGTCMAKPCPRCLALTRADAHNQR